MNTIKTIEQMLASLAGYRREMNDGQPCDAEKAGQALLEELKEQEPVAWTDENVIAWCLARGIKAAGDTNPQPAQPKREWVGLTEQERNDIEDLCEMMIGKPTFDAIEAKLKEKNSL